jgi:hypothetical protein
MSSIISKGKKVARRATRVRAFACVRAGVVVRDKKSAGALLLALKQRARAPGGDRILSR